MKIELNSNENYSGASEKITIVPNAKYQVSTEVKGQEGKAYCAYFGVVIRKDDQALSRRIRWLNDFSGIKKQYSLIFEAPDECDNLVVIYRINKETPLKTSCKYEIKSPQEIVVEKVSPDLDENFELPNNYSLPRLKELDSDEESILEKNIVWIFASRRSGTTWLARELLSLGTRFMNEPLIGDHLGFVKIASRNSIKRNIDIFKKDASYFFSDHYREIWKYYLRKLILNRIFSQFQDLTKKIVIKEPNGSMGANIISECLPNSKIIILLRDGRDVMDSRMDAKQKGSWQVVNRNLKPISNEERLPYIKEKAQEWVRLMDILMKTYNSHSKDFRLLVRYEDLRHNTLNEVKKIYRFLGIEISENDAKNIVEKYSFENIPEEQKGKGKFIRTANPGGWKENFNEKEVRTMEEIMGDTLRDLKYS